MQLDGGGLKADAIVASTLVELRGLLDDGLVAEGLVKDVRTPLKSAAATS